MKIKFNKSIIIVCLGALLAICVSGKELAVLDFNSLNQRYADLYTEHGGVKCLKLEAPKHRFILDVPSVECIAGTKIILKFQAFSDSDPQGGLTVRFQKYDAENKKYIELIAPKNIGLSEKPTEYIVEVPVPEDPTGAIKGRLLVTLHKKKGISYLTGLNVSLTGAENFALRDVSVVLAANAGAGARFAARELAYYIGEITGRKIALVTDEKDVTAPKIYVGVREGLVVPDLTQCVYDGYWLFAQPDGSLLIAGRSDKGTEFGVYGFLQDFCGIRFYFSGREGTFVPKKPDLKVPLRNKLDNPFFRNRNFYSSSGYDRDWFRHNRAIDRYSCHHALTNIITDKYAKTNPEYFAYSKDAGTRLLPGVKGRKSYQQQPCMTNPEVIRLCVEYAVNYFKNNPEEECVAMGINDNTAFCQCPECEKVNEGSGINDVNMKSYGKLTVHFYNAIAEGLTKVYPDRYIGVMGYNNTRTVPEGYKYHPAVVFRVAESEALYFDPGTVNYSGIARFRDSCSTLMLSGWRYGIGYLVPNFPQRLEEQFLDFCAALKIFGISKEVFTYWRLNGIKDYIYMRKLWNPALRSQEMLEEFAENMYGGGAPEILKFYDLARRTWEDQRVEYPHGEHLRNTTGQFKLYNAAICAQLLKHLENAHKLAGKDIHGAIWLDRQIELFRWIGEFHQLAAVWSAPEPQSLPELGEWCIAFEKMRRGIDRKFQLIREPQVEDFMKRWFPAVNNAFLLLKRSVEAGNMGEWKRFVGAVGEHPEIQWLDQNGIALINAENRLKNPDFQKNGTAYSAMLMASGKITDWHAGDWMGSKKPGGRRVDSENGVLVLEGIQGRRTKHPIPVVSQPVVTTPGECYVFMAEYRCAESENFSGTPWMSGYKQAPYSDTFKPYIIFHEAPKSGREFSAALAMTGLGKITYRKPVFAAVPSMPQVSSPRHFTNHVPPVLPESTVFDLSKGARRVSYSYEGLYNLKVRVTVSGSGSIKITAAETSPRWTPRRTQEERGEVFNASTENREQTLEFIYQPKENYTYSTTFRFQKSGSAEFKSIEFIPVPR